MPNYAYPARSTYNTGSFRNYAQNMNQLDANVWDYNPTEAYQWWLSHLNPSNVDDNMLRQMYSRMQSRYMSRQIADPTGSMYPDETSFVSYLAKQNPQQELARYSPQARGATRREFTRPARWVPY